MNPSERYLQILKGISSYYGIDESGFIKLLGEKENKYLLLLFLKKYRCMDKENIKKVLNYKSTSSINYTLKKAEEKLLINRDFRKKFFEIEETLLK